MATRRNPTETPRRKRPPATTPEARENQLIALAVDLVERKLLDGTASSQEVTHFLKLGSSRERLEQEKLQMEQELTRGRIEQMASAKRVEELYGQALKAMKSYAGQTVEEDPDDEDY